MPLKLCVGLSKKVGQRDYGSLGASCGVEVELDSHLLEHDLDGFHRRVRDAFIACEQAVHDELSRVTTAAAVHDALANGNAGQSGTANGRNGTENPNATRRSRSATSAQVRTICNMANRQGVDLAPLLHSRFGARAAAQLSIAEASQLIDELKQGLEAAAPRR
jgi:hypothetical protein